MWPGSLGPVSASWMLGYGQHLHTQLGSHCFVCLQHICSFRIFLVGVWEELKVNKSAILMQWWLHWASISHWLICSQGCNWVQWRAHPTGYVSLPRPSSPWFWFDAVVAPCPSPNKLPLYILGLLPSRLWSIWQISWWRHTFMSLTVRFACCSRTVSVFLELSLAHQSAIKTLVDRCSTLLEWLE